MNFMETQIMPPVEVNPPLDLSTISEEALLKIRMRDLPIKIEGTWLEECIAVGIDPRR